MLATRSRHERRVMRARARAVFGRGSVNAKMTKNESSVSDTRFHCTDCIYSSFSINKESGKYQGYCTRGYTLADPHVHEQPQMFFADRPEQLVPMIDPYGKEYLRTKNICGEFDRHPHRDDKGSKNKKKRPAHS